MGDTEQKQTQTTEKDLGLKISANTERERTPRQILQSIGMVVKKASMNIEGVIEKQQIATLMLRKVREAFKDVSAIEEKKGRVGEPVFTREQVIKLDDGTCLSLTSMLPNTYTIVELTITRQIRQREIKHRGPSKYRLNHSYLDDEGHEHSETFEFTEKPRKLRPPRIDMSASHITIPRPLVDSYHEGTARGLPPISIIDQKAIPERIQAALAKISIPPTPS